MYHSFRDELTICCLLRRGYAQLVALDGRALEEARDFCQVTSLEQSFERLLDVVSSAVELAVEYV